MRRIILTLLCLVPMCAMAQVKTSVGLYATHGEAKIMTEATQVTDNSTAYAYTEISTFKTWYGQFFYERKWWDTPVYLHAEYRGTVYDAFESSAYLGAAWCVFADSGFLAIEPLAAWKQNLGFGAQLSVVGNWDWKWFSLEHYTDIWRTHKMQSVVDAYAEVRGYFKACDWLSIGLVGTSYWSYSYNPDFGIYLAFKFNL